MKTLHTAKISFLMIGISAALYACGNATMTTQILSTPFVDNQSMDAPAGQAAETVQASVTSYWVERVPQIDNQGAVSIEITPLNLDNPGQTLDFQAVLNTHSVDLSMDLASLATLETDTGHTVQALSWDGSLGGHHVQGTLSFPSVIDGVSLLEGASKMTLTLVNVDAPERVFVWQR